MIDNLLDLFRELPGKVAAVAVEIYATAPTWAFVFLFVLGAALFLAGAAGIVINRRRRRPAAPVVEPAPAPARARSTVSTRRALDRAERERTRLAHPEWDVDAAAITTSQQASLARLDAEFERALTLRGRHAARAMSRF
jgi:hypothetical protein